MNYNYVDNLKIKTMKKSEQIIEQINEMVDKPFVSAKFGDNWKNHQKRMLDEGQLDIDIIIEIAWKQGRRALLMEDSIRSIVDKD